MTKLLLTSVLVAAVVLGACGRSDDTIQVSTPGADRSAAQRADVDRRPERDRAPRRVVRISEEADFGAGLRVKVQDVRPVELEARAPGEIAGPGIQVTVVIRNTSSKVVDVSGFVLNARQGDEVASPHSTGASPPAEAELAPGRSTTATYLFRIPNSAVDLVLDLHHDRSPNTVIVEAHR